MTPSHRYSSQHESDPQELVRQLEQLDQYFDPAYAKSLVENILVPINQWYFKSEFVGFENLPHRNNPDRPLIYVSNHSGMAFPWDGIMFSSLLFQRHDFQFKNAVRALSAPALSQSNLMNPFLIEDFWKINGAVEARYKYFEIMMNYRQSNLLIYPEGVPGIGKGFNRRYQLQRFATSFVRMSLKYKTDIIPFATVNGEYINPYVLSWPWLNKWSEKIGIPYIPVGFHTLLLVFFPWLFYYGLPARMTYVMGKPIKPYQMINKPYNELSSRDIQDLRDRIKATMQHDLDQAVQQYGQKKYSAGKLKGRSLSQIIKLLYYSPPGWPLLFYEHHRLYRKHGGAPFKMKIGTFSWIRFILKNPFTVAFYLPIIGWIPLLIKGYWKHNVGK